MRVPSSGPHPDATGRLPSSAVVDDQPAADTALSLLSGPDAGDLLDEAADAARGRILRWSLRDLDHRPGGRTTATYDAEVAWPDGARHEVLAATVAEDDSEVTVWRHPFDPELPALAGACFPETVAPLLRDLGLADAGLRLRVVTYRPRRRAVVEVTTDQARLFLKVLRPAAAADLHRRHTLLHDAGLPVARSYGHSAEGLVVMAALPGRPLGEALVAGKAASAPRSLTGLLDVLPDEVRYLPRRRPWSDHVRHYAEVVAATMPGSASRARSIATTVGDALATVAGPDPGTDSSASTEPGPEPVEATHGDFYESQVLVDDHGAVTGLLDLDSIGPGRRADDFACLSGHLSVIADASGWTSAAAAYVERWQAEIEQDADPRDLRVRAAAVVMSLAPGPYRTREPGWADATERRLALAERWLAAAGDSTRDGLLRALSSGSPGALTPAPDDR